MYTVKDLFLHRDKISLYIDYNAIPITLRRSVNKPNHYVAVWPNESILLNNEIFVEKSKIFLIKHYCNSNLIFHIKFKDLILEPDSQFIFDGQIGIPFMLALEELYSRNLLLKLSQVISDFLEQL